MKSVYRNFRLLLLLAATVLLASCMSQKRIAYFQAKGQQVNDIPVDTVYNAIIQPNDILTIYITSISEEAARYFNFSPTPDDVNSLANGYVVSREGNIDIPLAGSVHVGGLTSIAAKDSVKRKLEKYLVNPTVKLSIRNFR